MKKILHILKIFGSFFGKRFEIWPITVAYFFLFAWSIFNDAVRTSGLINIFWGALTINTPVIVLIAFIASCIIMGRVRFTLKNNKDEFVIGFLPEKKIAEIDTEVSEIWDDDEISVSSENVDLENQ